MYYFWVQSTPFSFPTLSSFLIFCIHHHCCYLLCRSSRFVIRMSRDSYTHLKRHLQERHLTVLINMIQEHLFIEGRCFFATRVIGGHLALTFFSFFFCLDLVYVSDVGKCHFRLSHYFIFQLHILFEDTVCIYRRLANWHHTFLFAKGSNPSCLYVKPIELTVHL